MPTQTLVATTQNNYADLVGRRIAYRTFGSGPPLVFALRFRGVMDTWDPAFLDTLAGSTHSLAKILVDGAATKSHRP